ncbi:hypothetical protein CK489_29120 [Bradyrhizobium sp. UFLA03-84]|uniref:hypothetical protein n=1 Tax=Bradyrhizobium sp. UFLA03-84 TaxID=418599 RepID=UPI000BAE24D5|nr:hypothetical protein [Bradyrhizobium sp. UFLA03-84]PAY05447.1 hypothetical protein CK489_29120 [Bradyrhizobium sp. UFLA03-84]
MNDAAKLQTTVDDAVAEVSRWRNTCATIAQMKLDANAMVSSAKKRRAENALAAMQGDAQAKAAIAEAQTNQAGAENSLVDLDIAAGDSQLKLEQAVVVEKQARLNLAQHQAALVKRKRVDVAGQLDAAIAEVDRLFKEYEQLGGDVIALGALPTNIMGMADREAAVGLRRVRAAMPRWVEKLYPGAAHDEMPREPLAVTEAQNWNLKVAGDVVIEFVGKPAA